MNVSQEAKRIAMNLNTEAIKQLISIIASIGGFRCSLNMRTRLLTQCNGMCARFQYGINACMTTVSVLRAHIYL